MAQSLQPTKPEGAPGALPLSRNAVLSQLHRMYVATERDMRLEAALQELIDGVSRHEAARAAGDGFVVGRLAEGRSLWLLGASGVGKTRALQRLFARTPEFDGYADPNTGSLLVSVNVPSPFTLRQFAQELAKAIGYETTKDLRENEAWALARSLIKERIRYIHVDEAHNFLENNNRLELKKARNALRGLVQNRQWPVSLILSGLPYAELIGRDFQVGRRHLVVRFANLSIDRDAGVLRSAFASFCDKAGVDGAQVLGNDETLDRLVYAGRHRLGVVLELMQDAIGFALSASDGVVTLNHLADAYERRTGCTPSDNVLTMREGWRGVLPDSAHDYHIPTTSDFEAYSRGEDQ